MDDLEIVPSPTPVEPTWGIMEATPGGFIVVFRLEGGRAMLCVDHPKRQDIEIHEHLLAMAAGMVLWYEEGARQPWMTLVKRTDAFTAQIEDTLFHITAVGPYRTPPGAKLGDLAEQRMDEDAVIERGLLLERFVNGTRV